jgi:hypothetical protein
LKSGGRSLSVPAGFGDFRNETVHAYKQGKRNGIVHRWGFEEFEKCALPRLVPMVRIAQLDVFLM